MESRPLPAVGHTIEFARTADSGLVSAFVDLVDDENPIYLDEDYAGRTPYGRRLVPGSFLVGLVNTALSRLTGPGYVLMGQELRFAAAVYVDTTVRVVAEVLGVREDKRIVTAETLVLRDDDQQALRSVGGLMQLELTGSATGR